MIIRQADVPLEQHPDAKLGAFDQQRYGDAGKLTQYGAYLETLHPGSQSSERHWHEREDEFLYVVSGTLTVIENDGAHELGPGDAACWPAGVSNAHHAVNNSDQPVTYLIFGTRLTHDVCHYPDSGNVLHTEGETWRMVDAAGKELRSGKME